MKIEATVSWDIEERFRKENAITNREKKIYPVDQRSSFSGGFWFKARNLVYARPLGYC
jgi:hypothetical protein